MGYVPVKHKEPVRKLLPKYIPINKDSQQHSINRKTKDYLTIVNTYILQPTLKQNAQEKTSKLIKDDVNKTSPES